MHHLSRTSCHLQRLQHSLENRLDRYNGPSCFYSHNQHSCCMWHLLCRRLKRHLTHRHQRSAERPLPRSFFRIRHVPALLSESCGRVSPKFPFHRFIWPFSMESSLVCLSAQFVLSQSYYICVKQWHASRIMRPSPVKFRRHTSCDADPSLLTVPAAVALILILRRNFTVAARVTVFADFVPIPFFPAAHGAGSKVHHPQVGITDY